MKNYFYLIVGLLCVLFAMTHTWNGQSSVFPIMNTTQLDPEIRTIFTYLWHIIAMENLIFGIALIIMSFHKNQPSMRFTIGIIITIMLMRWLIILLVTLKSKSGHLNQLLPDTIAILAIIILLGFGTRVKKQNV